jgi:hypothetical protein
MLFKEGVGVYSDNHINPIDMKFTLMRYQILVKLNDNPRAKYTLSLPISAILVNYISYLC